MSVPEPGYFEGSLSQTRRLINLLSGYGIARCRLIEGFCAEQPVESIVRSTKDLNRFIIQVTIQLYNDKVSGYKSIYVINIILAVGP
jgi:hypothetical protein